MSEIASTHSSFLEKLIEHLIVGEILRYLWLKGFTETEVLTAEIDAAGWDIGLAIGEKFRFIQLKMKRLGGKNSRFKINRALEKKPGGCVVVIHYNDTNLNLGPFLWYGGDKPSQSMPPLPNRIAKHTKGNKDGIKTERPNIRELNKCELSEVASVAELVNLLFPETIPH